MHCNNGTVRTVVKKRYIDIEAAIHEIQQLSALKHKNIINLEDVIDEEGSVGLILENAYELPKTNSYSYLDHERQAKHDMKQVLEALQFIHQKQFIHHDVKLANIVLGADGLVKIIDFGSCIQNGEDSRQFTLMYLPIGNFVPLTNLVEALEAAISKSTYVPTDKTDVWAFGCALYERITECKIWVLSSEQTFNEQCSTIITKYINNFVEFPQQMTAEAKDLITLCLARY